MSRVAGLTLGGGLGWLHRERGLTVDQLLSVELVTAAGERVTASHDENPELFWGLRGAGFTVNITGNSVTAEGFEAEREWVHALSAALRPHRAGVDVNFGGGGPGPDREASGDAEYARPQALKRVDDPTNLFRLNQNIPPDEAAPTA